VAALSQPIEIRSKRLKAVGTPRPGGKLVSFATLCDELNNHVQARNHGFDTTVCKIVENSVAAVSVVVKGPFGVNVVTAA
jgi:hypothetical protein